MGEGRDERDVVGDCADDVDVLEEGGQMGRIQQLEQGGKHPFRVLGGLWKGRKERGKERNGEEEQYRRVRNGERKGTGKGKERGKERKGEEQYRRVRNGERKGTGKGKGTGKNNTEE